MSTTFAAQADTNIPLHIVDEEGLEAWLAQQSDAGRRWALAQGFTGSVGQGLVLLGDDGTPALAAIGYGTAKSRARGRFVVAAGAAKLPKGVYDIGGGLDALTLETECVGWLLSGYRFDRYRKQAPLLAELAAPKEVNAQQVEAQVTGA
jgi:leucyl aminopeptidase